MRTFSSRDTANLWGGAHETSFYSISQNPYCREEALRIVMPGIDESAGRLNVDDDDDVSLTSAVIQTLNEHKQLRHLELLVWPDDDGGLQLTVSALEPRKRADKVGVDTADPANWIEPVSTQLREAIPTSAGLEVGAVDFSSLGLTPVRAAAFLIEDHKHIPSAEQVDRELLRDLLAPYCTKGVPFLFQVIVSQGTSKTKFTMNSRLAVFDPEYHIRYDGDLRDQIKEGNPYDPAHVFKHANLTSTWNLPVEDFFQVGHRRIRPKLSNYRRPSDRSAAKRHLIGHETYASLLRGSPDGDFIFGDRLHMNCRIPVEEAHLEHLLEVPAVYPVEDCWDRAPGRAPPIFTTDQILTTATGTDQAKGTDATPAIPLDQASMDLHGSKEHNYVAALVEQYLLEEGATVRPGDGCDHLIDLDGYTWNGEIEIDNETSQFLVNVLRAIHQGRPLFLVTGTKKRAKRYFEALLQPWKETIDDGAVLYNHDQVELPDGRIPLLADDESRWVLGPDGTLTLRDGDGDVIASGHGDDSVATFEYDTYHLVEQGSRYVVEDADGTAVSSYDRAAAVSADWTRVATPIVPPHRDLITQLEDLIIRYADGKQLPIPYLGRDWDVDPELRRARTKVINGSEAEHQRRYLIERDDDDLPEVRYDDYFDRYREWFAVLCDHDRPEKQVWGGEAPDTKRRSVEGVDGKVRFLREYTWVFPSGLTPPDLPFRGDTE